MHDTLPEYGSHEDVTHIFGLKRAHLYALAKRGQIRAVSLRKPGARKGKTLFYLPSIRKLLNEATEQETIPA